jgi:N-acetylneuraminate synthase
MRGTKEPAKEEQVTIDFALQTCTVAEIKKRRKTNAKYLGKTPRNRSNEVECDLIGKVATRI